MEKVQINGKEYELDVNKAKELGILKEPYRPKRKGQHFRNLVSQNKYVLAGTGESNNKLVLVNIHTGGAFREAQLVEDPACVTEKEWNNLLDGYLHLFKEIDISITEV